MLLLVFAFFVHFYLSCSFCISPFLRYIVRNALGAFHHVAGLEEAKAGGEGVYAAAARRLFYGHILTRPRLLLT